MVAYYHRRVSSTRPLFLVYNFPMIVRGKVWWAKRRRKIVRRDNGKVVEFEEVRYGMLMMVLCDREGF